MAPRSKRTEKVAPEDFCNLLVESELEDSDDDEAECTFEQQSRRIRIGSQVLTLDEEQFVEDDSDEDDFEGWSSLDLLTNVNAAVTKTGIDQWKWTPKDKVKWGKGIVNKHNFEYQQTDDDDADEEYWSPLEYFSKYIPESIFDDMVTYTNLYAEQQDAKKWRPTDKAEMKIFIGLQIMMGNLKLPRIELYYSKELDLKMFTDSIPIYRFYLLRTNFHLIDVTTIPNNSSDKFIRVRPLMDSVRRRCLQLPLEEYLSIDEQMIPMRGRATKGVKQFVKNKPKIRWGIKNLAFRPNNILIIYKY
ncbi:piggyBac transposable element-derived protein 4-like [Bradysia coprophila]|uniref:piggyBac transposable element-derived protein 4-like n=1 Tax=Bradysia coprophila TaxID=38358 RepID=UPI00187DA6BB|nr:piggyBac transposable element-derived protein 4-like [Bradysia coprophila]